MLPTDPIPSILRSTHWQRYRRSFSILIGCVFVLALGNLANATWVENDHAFDDLKLEAGIAGHFKLGSWTELRFRLPLSQGGPTTKVTVIVLDSDGVPTSTLANPWRPVENENEYRVPVKIGRRESAIQLKIETAENGKRKTSVYETSISQLGTPLSASSKLFVQVGPDFGLSKALVRYASQTKQPIVFVQLEDTNQIPVRWYMLEGVDHLIWVCSGDKTLANLTTAQHDSLQEWLKLGGRVTLSVGESAVDFIGADKPLAFASPGPLREVVQVNTTTELEAIVSDVSRLDRPVVGSLTVALLDSYQGQVLLEEGSRQATFPLWVRQSVGFGTVDFFGFDLSAEPIASWQDRESLLKVYLASISGMHSETGESSNKGNQVAHFGYTDISGQIRLALDKFPRVRNVSFFIVGAIIVVYLALIGPGDYFFLDRLRIRKEWTWVTFPTLILVTCFGIWGLASWWKGTTLKINQVEVLDIDLASRTARSTVWFHLFSPSAERYDISAQSSSSYLESWNHLMSWQGLAGSGLGGMSARQSLSSVPTPYAYIENDDHTLENVPVQTWASKTLLTRSWGILKPIEFDPLQQRESDLISGPLLNPTDMTLTDCFVFHRRWVYYVPKIGPGEVVYIEPGHSEQNAEKLLRRRRAQEATDSGELWDPQSTDIDRIMQISMFFDVAGGESYTNLTNNFQQYVDLSSQAQGDRAVLVGTIEQPVTTIQIDGETVSPENLQTWSYARIVIPVRPQGSN